MTMYQKTFYLLVLLLPALTMGCRQDCENSGNLRFCLEGCTDTDAINYNPRADWDDGSCDYFNFPSRFVFFATVNKGGPVYISGRVNSDSATRTAMVDQYVSRNCGDSGSFTVEIGRDFSVDEQDWVFSYTASDSSGNSIDSSFSIQDSGCYVIEVWR